MNAYIYLEGGATGEDSKEVTLRCQAGFRKLLESLGFRGRMPRLVASGGRDFVYKDFVVQHTKNSPGVYTAMLIDSEEPMEDVERAWHHLTKVSTVAK